MERRPRRSFSEDVIPVTNRCVTIQSDEVQCGVLMGQALETLGKSADARNAYERAIGIGGYNERSAQAIEIARQQLAEMDSLEKSLDWLFSEEPRSGLSA